MKCREGCGACCIAPSISSAMPRMPEGKPAGERCLHLTVDNLCDLFGKPERVEGSRRMSRCVAATVKRRSGFWVGGSR